jgi:hypothetical protein
MRILLLAFTLCLALNAQAPGKTAVPDEVSAMRLINTVSFTALKEFGRFPNWDELLRSQAMARTLEKNPALFHGVAAKLNPKDPANFFPGHKIRWSVGGDGKSYDVAIMPERKAGSYCSAPTWFSNDAGVIYQGYALDCRVTASDGKDKVKVGD